MWRLERLRKENDREWRKGATSIERQKDERNESDGERVKEGKRRAFIQRFEPVACTRALIALPHVRRRLPGGECGFRTRWDTEETAEFEALLLRRVRKYLFSRTPPPPR